MDTAAEQFAGSRFDVTSVRPVARKADLEVGAMAWVRRWPLDAEGTGCGHPCFIAAIGENARDEHGEQCTIVRIIVARKCYDVRIEEVESYASLRS